MSKMGIIMWDLVLTATTVVFFAVAMTYVRGCEWLGRKPGQRDVTREPGVRP